MIRVGSDDGLCVITIDRPDRRNALTSGMLAELVAAFEGACEASACLLLGAGPVFCAGFDLHEGASDPSMGVLRAQLRHLAAALDAMRRILCPVVVGVQGAAIAGGCALLGGADLVVADRGARLGYPVVRLGISPAVTAPYLRQRVGDGAARALLLDPALISGERAAQIGLVDHLVASACEVEPEARRLARELASRPRGAMRATRRWVSALAPDLETDAALRASLEAVSDETFLRLQREVWSR